ncbi:tyrosine-type recombinase/integrase [Paraburkholderia adhaesiva]|uniref:tyrosine-type recombinase/integrase n=1 Tax=Paraburkholderia adhaesiva TaxID=2883244 RepID=UPI001F1B1108|nr:tyrosine-type recombinase/integrase [Paraburkholderia adhaesiva]
MQRYFLLEEQHKLLEVVGGINTPIARRDHALFRALLHSGCRGGEFLAVTVGATMRALVDNYLFIPREHRKKKTVGEGSMRRVIADDHSVYVTVPLREALEDLLRAHADTLRAAGLESDSLDPDAPLVISREGGALTMRAMQLRFKEWLVTAGLPRHATPHWLRHTRAMNIMRSSSARDPRGVVKSVLGHRSIESTGVYTGVTREEVESALNTVDAAPRRRLSLSAKRRVYDAANA